MKIRHLELVIQRPPHGWFRLWEWCSLFLAIYFFKDLAGGFVPSPAGYILFMWEGYGKGRVGIDGCWQILDTVYDVLITCFSGNGVYGFSVADFSQ